MEGNNTHVRNEELETPLAPISMFLLLLVIILEFLEPAVLAGAHRRLVHRARAGLGCRLLCHHLSSLVTACGSGTTS